MDDWPVGQCKEPAQWLSEASDYRDIGWHVDLSSDTESLDLRHPAGHNSLRGYRLSFQ